MRVALAWLVALHMTLALPVAADECNGDCTDRRACRETFDATVAPVLARCGGYGGRGERQDLLRQARDTLIATGLLPASAFQGVTIQWCPLTGSGMVPDPDLVLLNPGLQSNLFALTSILGHEMKHVEQYRRWGADGFKCRYSAEIRTFKGLGRGNSVEREAYDFQDRVEATLKNASSPRQAP